MSASIEALLQPPMTVTRVASREPVLMQLGDDERYLPVSSYPCGGGLQLLAQYYRPNMPLLARHREYVPGEEDQGHTVLPAGIVRRSSCIGTLYERHRSLEKVFHQVMEENASLSSELARLRELLDGGRQVEELSQSTLEREREVRRAADRERSVAVRNRDEAEARAEHLGLQVAQLQSMLQQAADTHRYSGHHVTVGRVGV